MTVLGPDRAYAARILPALVVLRLGVGLVLAPGTSGATAASAGVNTMQQVGGSIGVALLSSVAACAASAELAGASPAAWSGVRAALIRPDGHVAWAGTDRDDDRLAAVANEAVSATAEAMAATAAR
ncbi:hypothetical protein OHA79_08095 [Streptomyces sp. NBC_00841]|uniref:aromatic-ring hydroxylase C-terminal domain-containing protein n=1 Tax=unclassified Streptomyces TaxID=2593676 RepID=UPI00224F0AF0|nr:MULTISPECIES: hypothetical protein [unclassified Streptomyces]MCX4536932.1 hypothetical protein [Streptomyces sp. NBC_01669]WRZ97815.1 hypothetical protein OHA79_08095 [Streptomyces sp. NBC_00841]